MTEIPCRMVIEHEGILGGMRSSLGALAQDITYIKMRVDDGLATKVSKIEKELDKSVANGKIDAAQIKAEVAVAAAELRSENWFGRILTGSVTKMLGIGVGFIILSALANSGVGLLVKEKYSLELPGQQKEILKQQAVIQSTLGVYHNHELADGRNLFHSGDPDKPAWILNSKTGAWEKAPSMRTEAGIK